MNQKTILALSISTLLLTSNVNASNKVADARGNAMGNTGVASADYLTAPFYNPALGASFKNDDNFGLLIPAIGVSVSDKDDSLTTIDDLQSSIEAFEASGSTSASDLEDINRYLDQLDGNTPLTVTAGLGFAIAFPTKVVSANLFAHGYTEIVADTQITASYLNSTADMRAFGYSEVGLALAKEYSVLGERVSFGVTPKYQNMATYAQLVTIRDFDIEDYDENKITKNAFNFDLGAMWYKDNFRVGIAVKDILAQEIDVFNGTSINDTYNLDTQVTAAVAYSSDYFTAAVDADLTKQTRFQNLDDDTQFLRFGLEGNAWGWAALRAGYEVDLQDTIDNTFTAGIGISPFDLVRIDIAGAYTGENQLGASANLAFTF
ncbi:conjugal transfer protein TraF [Psychromonas sp.]|uniref:conjugal transfer protein TraF n=1 Tax=Psychromonas sp. TaxID=1884585 RepID=UPI0039E6F941